MPPSTDHRENKFYTKRQERKKSKFLRGEIVLFDLVSAPHLKFDVVFWGDFFISHSLAEMLLQKRLLATRELSESRTGARIIETVRPLKIVSEANLIYGPMKLSSRHVGKRIGLWHLSPTMALMPLVQGK